MPRLASISLDLDNQWAYMKTQGVEGWQSYPSYFPTAVPRILALLKELNQSITFFIVGKDAQQQENHFSIQQIAAAGHELANHSFMHEPWLHLYDEAQLTQELEHTERAVHQLTGATLRGFRGPGFSTSPTLRRLLVERGYQYEASSFPTVIGPVARTYFFLFSQLSAEEKKKRSGLYGSITDALGSLHPYQITPGLLEMPVTTMPLTRLPVHMSYLMFLAQRSESLARLYWRTTLLLCRLRGIAPSLLLHPTDFLDVQDVPEMSFFPAMSLPAERKLSLVRYVIQQLQRHYTVGTVAQHAASCSPSQQAPLSTYRTPEFSTTPSTSCTPQSI
jgi:peptidoglycan-N-acetylglucosamine deacetylase